MLEVIKPIMSCPRERGKIDIQIDNLQGPPLCSWLGLQRPHHRKDGPETNTAAGVLRLPRIGVQALLEISRQDRHTLTTMRIQDVQVLRPFPWVAGHTALCALR